MKLPEKLPKIQLDLDPNKLLNLVKNTLKEVKGIAIEIRWHLLKD